MIDSFIGSLVHSVSLRGFCHVFTSQPPFAHELMHLAPSTDFLLPFPIFETSASARAGHYLALN